MSKWLNLIETPALDKADTKMWSCQVYVIIVQEMSLFHFYFHFSSMDVARGYAISDSHAACITLNLLINLESRVIDSL